MDTLKIAAIVLIAFGFLALVYGGFSYTRETQQAHLGPISMTVSDTQTVNVPVWAGIGATALGGVLLVLALGRRRG